MDTYNYEGSLEVDGTLIEGHVCQQWAYDQLFSPLLSNLVTALIVVINYILRLVMILLIK